MSWRGLDLLYLPWKKVNQSNMKEERIRYSCQRQVDSASVLIPSHVPAEVFTSTLITGTRLLAVIHTGSISYLEVNTQNNIKHIAGSVTTANVLVLEDSC